MDSARRIVKNTLSLLVATVIPKGLLFLLVVYAARQLGPYDYGVYATAAGLVMIISVLADFGINQLMIQELARAPHRLGELFWGVLLLKVGFFTAMAGLLVLLPLWLGYDARVKIAVYILGASALVTGTGEHMAAVFRAKERMELVAAAPLLKAITALGFYWAAMRMGLGVVGLVMAFLLGSLVGTLCSVGILLFSGTRPGWPARLGLVIDRGLVARSVPFMLMYLSMALFQKVDIVLLSKFQGIVAVGWYDAAFKLIDAGTLLPAAVFGALFPYLSRRYVDSPEAMGGSCNRIFKYMLYVAMPVAVGGTVFGKQIIDALYGPEFANATIALQILSWALGLIFLNGFLSIAAVSADGLWFAVAANAVHLAATLTLNFLLVPSWSLNLGYVGSAWAVVLAEILNLVIWLWYFVRRRLQIALFAPGMKVLAAGIAMALCGLLFQSLPALASIALSIGMYAGILILLGGFDLTDRRLLWHLLHVAGRAT
jgi:O-antigen/teichoic acid export membrane protein